MNEVRVILRKIPNGNGKVEVSTYDPLTRREQRTGLTAGPDRESIDRAVRSIKETLERAGNRVSVVGP